MDFDVYNQETGDRLGFFTVRMSATYYWEGNKVTTFKFQAIPREGSINIDPTDTPEGKAGPGDCPPVDKSVFTLHS